MMIRTGISEWSLRRKAAAAGGLIFVLFACWLILPPGAPFPEDYSSLVFDSEGNLLRVTLSQDQQYRFPVHRDSLPAKYLRTLISAEDKRFFRHPGIDILALANAIRSNIRYGKIIRGGSTITMQVVRLAHPRPRTYLNKLLECLLALRYDFHFSKKELLQMYAAQVPMGRNIVGIESASRYYFGKPLPELTWAESALLVVLPNDPARVNLSRSRSLLKKKRDRLLKQLLDRQIIDSDTYTLACLEPLPEARNLIPFRAPHFTNAVLAAVPQQTIIKTTLDAGIQQRAEEICRRHSRLLTGRGIANLAVVIAETSTGRIRAYLGSHDFLDSLHQGQVDGVRAHRSTGSLLKPFLVAELLDKGPFTLQSRINDIPTFYGTFAPQNASKTFSGLTRLEDVLIYSLNVPAVRLLNSYGVRDFYHFLNDAGLKGLFRSADEYGLALILGGAEASLWEMTGLYLTLVNYGRPGRLRFLDERDTVRNQRESQRLFSEGAAWLTLKALNKLSRPGVEHYWHLFSGQVPVAWKTGTSYGQKDGWAIGVNGEWTIGVWAGNFTGEGNAELTGSGSAAPILFDLFNMLPSDPDSVWFEEPEYDLVDTECCSKSGYPAGPYCAETIPIKRPLRSYMPGTCPFHRRYIVDRRTGKSVCSLCWTEAETLRVNRFIMPAAVRDILVQRGFAVDNIPQHADYCPAFEDDSRLQIAYPVDDIRILVPRDLDGLHEQIVFSAVHQRPETELFWYLNGELVGNTTNYHKLPIDLKEGDYSLTVMDEEGFSRSVTFEAYRTEKARGEEGKWEVRSGK